MWPSQQKKNWLCGFLVWGLVLVIIAAAFLAQHKIGLASIEGGQATILPPNRIGGAMGQNDQRDADVYPAVAYDQTSGRYLAVWMTPRHAGSSSDGFDVYGVFLNRAGQPTGSEFRISDSNSAARGALPTIATSGGGEFVVAWTARGGSCQVYIQRVTDASSRPDRALTSGGGHHHSPNLVYNPARQRYALTYVEGNDYLPPTLFGAQTADCGNDAASTSRIKALDFYLDGDNPVISAARDISDVSSGAFRPRLAYSAGLNQYLVAWEDRRNSAGQAYRFEVYAQQLSSDMAIVGSDIQLAAGGDYANYDTSATWTPRPAVAGGDNRFLIAWFTHEVQDSAMLWSVTGRLVPDGGVPGTPFTIARMTFAQSHTGQSPTGFLAVAYLNPVQEYLVGMTSHLESVWGYLSLALVQRVSSDGQLLKLDGSIRSQPSVGNSVDYDNDDQVGIAIATNPISGVGTSDYLVAYSKHAPGRSSQDFDIWGARVRMPAPSVKGAYLPLVPRQSGSAPECWAESVHPYANSYNHTWTLTNPDAYAAQTLVHFSRLETEGGYDYVYVRDGSNNQINRLTGSYPSGLWSSPVPGRTVKIQLVTDGSITAWGFCVDRIESISLGE